CMNNQPRAATVAALEDGEVWIVRRNLLYVVQRDRHARERLDHIYRERALENHLRDVSFFADLDESERAACRKFLADRVELVRVRRDDFRELLRMFPALLKTFVSIAQRRLTADYGWSPNVNGMLAEFLDQGLYNGEKLLVLDMEACTRCDLCVKACGDSH